MNSDVEMKEDGEEGSEEGSERSSSDGSDDDEEQEVALMPLTREGHRVLPGVTAHSILEHQPMGTFVYENCFVEKKMEANGGAEKQSTTSTVVEVAREQCRRLKTAAKTGDEYSSGSTYWIGAEDEPRCVLERLALEIFHQYTKKNTAQGVHIASKFMTENEDGSPYGRGGNEDDDDDDDDEFVCRPCEDIQTFDDCKEVVDEQMNKNIETTDGLDIFGGGNNGGGGFQWRRRAP
eukprot:GSA25T00007265001.1